MNQNQDAPPDTPDAPDAPDAPDTPESHDIPETPIPPRPVREPDHRRGCLLWFFLIFLTLFVIYLYVVTSDHREVPQVSEIVHLVPERPLAVVSIDCDAFFNSTLYGKHKEYLNDLLEILERDIRGTVQNVRIRDLKSLTVVALPNEQSMLDPTRLVALVRTDGQVKLTDFRDVEPLQYMSTEYVELAPQGPAVAKRAGRGLFVWTSRSDDMQPVISHNRNRSTTDLPVSLGEAMKLVSNHDHFMVTRVNSTMLAQIPWMNDIRFLAVGVNTRRDVMVDAYMQMLSPAAAESAQKVIEQYLAVPRWVFARIDKAPASIREIFDTDLAKLYLDVFNAVVLERDRDRLHVNLKINSDQLGPMIIRPQSVVQAWEMIFTTASWAQPPSSSQKVTDD